MSATTIDATIAEFTDVLLRDNWLDDSTRVMFTEMSVLMTNREQALVASAIMMFEFPPSGGVIPTVKTVPFIYHEKLPGVHIATIVFLALAVCLHVGKAVVVVFVLRKDCVSCTLSKRETRAKLTHKKWYSCRRCDTKFDRFCENHCPECDLAIQQWNHECLLHGFLLSVWTLVLTGNLALLIAQQSIMHIVRSDVSTEIDKMVSWKQNEQRDSTVSLPSYTDFGPMQVQSSRAFALLAINVLLSYFALYRFLVEIEFIGKFLRLFSVGASMLATFTLTFSIAFFGFAAAAHVAFGPHSDGFEDYGNSLLGTFELLTGGMSLADVESDSFWLGALLYCIFGVMYVFIALNVFIAIVSKAHEIATEQAADRPTQLSVRLLWRRLRGKDSSYEAYVKELHDDRARMVALTAEGVEECDVEVAEGKKATANSCNDTVLLIQNMNEQQVQELRNALVDAIISKSKPSSWEEQTFSNVEPKAPTPREPYS